MSSGVCVGPQASWCIVMLGGSPSENSALRASGSSQFSGFARAHVLRQLVMKIDGAAFAIGVGFCPPKAKGLHASLHRSHIREVLWEYRQPVRVADRGVLPLRLWLSAVREQLEHGYLEDALVRVVARMRPGAVAQRTGESLPDLKIREYLPRSPALPQHIRRNRRPDHAAGLVIPACRRQAVLEGLVGRGAL